MIAHCQRREVLRLLLLGGLGLGALLGGMRPWLAATASALRFQDRLLWRTPQRAIRENFSYLKLSEHTIARYVAEHAARFGPLPPLRRIPEAYYNSFLLSTDFFTGGADFSREPHYVRLHDPEGEGCRNPFAILES